MPEPSIRPLRAVVGIGLLFAGNGAVFAALLPWYPLFADRLGLDPFEFGLVVAAFAVGALSSSALPPPLVARFGPRPVTVVSTIALAASIAAAAWSSTGWVLAACVFAAGFSDAVADVAQNVAGVRVQAAVGRSILSSMHALWSLGAVIGGAASTVAAAAGVDPRLHLAVAAGVGLGAVACGAVLVGPAAAPRMRTVESPAPARQRWRLTAIAALPLVVVAVCGTTIEDVANNWAALAAVQIGGLPAEFAGIAFTVILASQCIGRFTGDPLITRFGRARVARAGGVLITAGGVAVVTAPHPLLLFSGLALVGFGCATLVPSALTAAGTLPGVTEGAGITLVSWLMRIGFLATSPVIGAVATVSDLRVGLGVIVVVGIATIALARHLEPHPHPVQDTP